MAPAFDISTTKGVGSLNGYLSGRSYLDGKGFSPSRTLILPSREHVRLASDATIYFSDDSTAQ